MKNKKMKIGIVLGLVILLIGVPSTSALQEQNASSEQIEKEHCVNSALQKLQGDHKFADLHLSITSTSANAYINNALPNGHRGSTGDYTCNLEIHFGSAAWDIKISGTWTARAVAITGASITFFDDSGEFEYIGDSPPDDIVLSATKFMPRGSYAIAITISIVGNIYVWHEEPSPGKWVYWKTNSDGDNHDGTILLPRNKTNINTPFLNFLQSHPNRFPILRHLLQLLGLRYQNSSSLFFLFYK